MLYAEAKKRVFAGGEVQDGYGGRTASVEFAFDKKTGKTLIVFSSGFYNSGLPAAIDEKEALWLLKNHPSADNIKVQTAIDKVCQSKGK